MTTTTTTTTTLVSAVGSVLLLASSTMAHANCSTSLNEKIASVAHVVDSLRPDKAGQMRTFASDGSEYTAGQASWMKGQLRGIERECAKSDDVAAAAKLQGLQDAVSAHQKPHSEVTSAKQPS
jgi:hypothetical protein